MGHSSPLCKVAVGLPVGDATYVQGAGVIARSAPEVFRTVGERNVNPRDPVVHGGEHCKRLIGQEFQEACGSSGVFLLNDIDHLEHQRKEKPALIHPNFRDVWSCSAVGIREEKFWLNSP